MANGLARAVMIGVAAGMRRFLAPAVLMSSCRDDACEGPVRSISRVSVIALSASELVGDKTSYIGNRTDPGPLFARILSGAVCGATASGQNGGEPLGGLVGGGLAAFASANARLLPHSPRTRAYHGRSRRGSGAYRGCNRLFTRFRGF